MAVTITDHLDEFGNVIAKSCNIKISSSTNTPIVFPPSELHNVVSDNQRNFFTTIHGESLVFSTLQENTAFESQVSNGVLDMSTSASNPFFVNIRYQPEGYGLHTMMYQVHTTTGISVEVMFEGFHSPGSIELSIIDKQSTNNIIKIENVFAGNVEIVEGFKFL